MTKAPFQQLDQLDEIRQRSGKAVDLTDDDDIDFAGTDDGHACGQLSLRSSGKISCFPFTDVRLQQLRRSGVRCIHICQKSRDFH